jgi:hypothetical protein
MTAASAIREATVSAVVFSAAITLAALLSTIEGIAPIIPALAASLLLAGLEWRLALAGPYADFEPTAHGLAHPVVAFAVAFLGLSLVKFVLPSAVTFVCEPLVPWGISIGIFGAFSVAWMVAALRVRGRADLQPLVHVAFSWIAPFYGFFYSPWFVAQTLILDCSGRPVVQSLLVGAAMILADIAGAWVAACMFDGPH